MPDNNLGAPEEIPRLRDRRMVPPGVLPKNMQAYVICAIAAVMIGVFALSGRNAPKERAAKETPVPAAMDPNAARIQDYQKRIEEQAKKLAQEQAQLARSQDSLRSSPPLATAATANSVRGIYR